MRRLPRYQGYLLAEAAIVLALIGTASWAFSWYLDYQVRDMGDQEALAAGQALDEANKAVGAYMTAYFQNLVLNKTINRCKVNAQNQPIDASNNVSDSLNCAPQLDSGGAAITVPVAEIYSPSLTQLRNLGLLRPDFPDSVILPQAAAPATFQLRVGRTGNCLPVPATVPQDCGLDSFITLSQPLLTDDGSSLPNERRLGYVVRTLGQLFGANTTTGSPTQFTGLNGQLLFDATSPRNNPNLVAGITTLGLLAARNGYNSQGFTEFLRRDGTLQMTNNLNLGGNTIVNVGGIEFADTFTPMIGEPCNLTDAEATAFMATSPTAATDDATRRKKRLMAKPGAFGAIRQDKPKASLPQNWATGMLLTCSYDRNKTAQAQALAPPGVVVPAKFAWLKATGGISGQEEAAAGLMDGYETNANFACWPDEKSGDQNYGRQPSSGKEYWNSNPDDDGVYHSYNPGYGLSWLKFIMKGGRVVAYARVNQPTPINGYDNRWVMVTKNGVHYNPLGEYGYYSNVARNIVPTGVPILDSQRAVWVCRLPFYIDDFSVPQGDISLNAFSSWWFTPSGVFYSAGGTRILKANRGNSTAPNYALNASNGNIPVEDESLAEARRVEVPVTNCTYGSTAGITYVASCTNTPQTFYVQGKLKTTEPIWYQAPVAITQSFNFKRRTICTVVGSGTVDWGLPPSVEAPPNEIDCKAYDENGVRIPSYE